MINLECSLIEVMASDALAVARYAQLRAQHLEQLVSPMDDMWLAFADMAQHFLLHGEGETLGGCALDAAGVLLGFYVAPNFVQHGPRLLRTLLAQLKAKQMLVCSLDPGYHSAALDVASSVETEAFLYTHVAQPECEERVELRMVQAHELEPLIDFFGENTGAPREFLEVYLAERIERLELLCVESQAGLLAIGELRADKHQHGVAHLGFVVRADERKRRLGTRVLCNLVRRAQALSLAPFCSTDASNIGAQRAIERAGFRCAHRVLRVEYAL